ncbi:DUF4054 domain-containing protein [Haemophilus haemoglobinophilus]|nr:DUF4054 domain-containing protein [Canicola haemoglobinophilus]
MKQLMPHFLARYPEFEKLDEEIIELFLSDAQTEISEKRWGKFYQRGVMALTAHLLKLREESKATGGDSTRPLASESAGELSVSYVTPMPDANLDYQTTAYGQEYLRLKRLVGVGVMVA